LHVQVNSQADPAALIDRLVADASPRPGALDAWRSFLQAHATLMRRLAGDLVQATGLSLGEFDVLAQLAVAGGELRMSELAGRALSSRSGMTRRVTRLVEESLVTRTTDDADARGVVVALTEAGIARLAEAAPVHLRGVVELFVSQLSDEELNLLKSALDKVTVECTFGS
jgi:DNA-binding MarR family transcriptional regulator